MNNDTHQNDDPESEPKIVVDSDWKEQVAREKAGPSPIAADKAPADTAPGKAAPADATADADVAVAGAAGDAAKGNPNPPPPPASFEIFVSMLFAQAMSLLGQVPDPATGEISVNKPYAKHYIETLEMVSEKTKGNLTDDEAAMLSEALHALRMTYVNVKSP